MMILFCAFSHIRWLFLASRGPYTYSFNLAANLFTTLFTVNKLFPPFPTPSKCQLDVTYANHNQLTMKCFRLLISPCTWFISALYSYVPLIRQKTLRGKKTYFSWHTKKGALRFSGLCFFKCTCTVSYLGYRHVFLSEASSRSLQYVCEQQKLERDCAYA